MRQIFTATPARTKVITPAFPTRHQTTCSFNSDSKKTELPRISWVSQNLKNAYHSGIPVGAPFHIRTIFGVMINRYVAHNHFLTTNPIYLCMLACLSLISLQQVGEPRLIETLFSLRVLYVDKCRAKEFKCLHSCFANSVNFGYIFFNSMIVVSRYSLALF